VLLGPEGPGAAAPLGTLREVRERLANFNTSTDGAPGKGMGTEILYGPGMVVELPTSIEPVAQAIATVSDEEIAWPVLMRICKTLRWRLMDMESGRVFGA
jgi:hypothetical protein